MNNITGRVSSVGGALVAGLVLLLASPTAVSANGDTPETPVACVMQSSEVVAGLAVFTVGPANCNIEIGPISFSTYDLPGGAAKPWSEQRWHSHSPENGRYYGPGTHQLSAPIGDLCNWQTDLYRGSGQGFAPHIHYLHGLNVGWDLSEGNVCTKDTTAEPRPKSPPPSPSAQVSGPGAPGPAVTGHGVFDTQSTGLSDRNAASLRPAPVIERTWSPSSTAPASGITWSPVTAALATTGLAVMLLVGFFTRRRRLGSD